MGAGGVEKHRFVAGGVEKHRFVCCLFRVLMMRESSMLL
jgi:hypothetical protein